MWEQTDSGNTLNTKGSEEGTIIFDQEYNELMRITIEKGTRNAPFSITVGIYGLFFHTIFANTKDQAFEHLDSMKRDMLEILHLKEKDIIYEKLQIFAETY